MDKKYYKVLKQGKSFHGGNFSWSLPTEDQPGDWHTIEGELALCSNGLHLTSNPAKWWDQDAECFEAEIEGEIIADGSDKIACRKVRLLRKLSVEELAQFQIFYDGEHTVKEGLCLAFGSSTVKAYNRSTVKAYDSSTVEAYNKSTVLAYNKSTVKANGNSIVTAYDNSTVEAYNNSTAEAYNNSTVEAYNSSTIKACNNSTVRAFGSSTIKAYNSSTVVAFGSSTITIPKYSGTTVAVTVKDEAVLIDRSKNILKSRNGEHTI